MSQPSVAPDPLPLTLDPDALGRVFAALPGLHLVVRSDAPRYTIADATDAYLAATFATRDGVVGRGLFEAFPDANPANPSPSGVANLRASLDRVVATGRADRMPEQRYDVAGPGGRWAVRRWEPMNSPVLDAAGRVVAVVHTVDDVTDREQQRGAAEAAQAQMEAVFSQAPVALAVTTGPEHRFVLANARYAELVGRPGEALVGRTFREAFPDLVGTPFFAFADQVYAGGEPMVMREVRVAMARDTGEGVFNAIYHPLRDADGRVIGVVQVAAEVTTEVTARRVLEEANAELAVFAALTEHSHDGQFLLDEAGRLHWVNRRAAEQLGYTRAELLTLGMGAWNPRVPTEAFPSYFERARRGRVRPFESVLRRKDGTEFPVEVAPTVVELPEGARMLAAVRDISDRKRADAERERLVAELAQASVAKGDFLATMSHEIRTPMNAITGYAELLELGLGGPITDVQRDYLGRLTNAGRHLLALVNDVLDLSKLDAGGFTVSRDPGTTDAVVVAAIDLVRPQAAARGVTVVDANPGHSEAYLGDEHRVRQILVNLLGNAVKFTPAGGSVTVTCARVDAAPPGTALRGAGPWAVVRVHDTGVGIAAADQAAVFEPFHQVEQGHTRTKGGTGLGLAISRRLARLMGGDLTVESAPGAGSTFTLWLPAVGAAEKEGGGGAEPAVARLLRAGGGPAPLVRGLGDVGELLRSSIEPIVADYVEQLRRDPAVPQARGMSRSAVEDHIGAFIIDMAQTLLMAEEGGPVPDTLTDGSAIARVVAERHGVRRAAQGWGERALRRDYALVGEVIGRVLRARAGAGGGDVEPALGVVLGFVARAEQTSVAAWRAEVETGGGGADG